VIAVRARGLAAGYGGAPAIRAVNFAAGPGQGVAVLGPNGGGKTTLFRALMGELEPITGEIEIPAAAGRSRAGYLAQLDRTRLDLPVTATDVALMGALGRGRWWLPPRRDDREAARVALARVGLEQRESSLFGELSGGERQRTLLARALVQDASLLLLDEPYAGVDPASAETLDGLFAELRAEGRTLLVATHDVESARAFDAVLCLNGEQVAFGAPDRVLTREVIEKTYGSELMVLESGDGPVRAVAVQHHEH